MIKNGWVVCPHCERRLFPVEKETIIVRLRYRCRYCKSVFYINKG